MSNNEKAPKGGLKMIISAIACVIVLAMGYMGGTGDDVDKQNAVNTFEETATKVESVSESAIIENVTAKEAETTTEKETEIETETESSQVIVVKEPFYFRTKSQWESHYEKHGIEMGFANKQEYLDAANRVIINPDALHKFEAEDGDDVYYVEATNEFVVVSKDGYIRTYFNPSDGLDYFNRQ